MPRMNASRTAGWILTVLAVAALVPALVFGIRDVIHVENIQKKIDGFVAERTQTRSELKDANIHFRGFKKSLPTLPDSLKMKQSGELMKLYKDYNKQVMVLENKERDQSRVILVHEREKDEVGRHMRRWAGSFGSAAVLLFILGLGLIVRSS